MTKISKGRRAHMLARMDEIVVAPVLVLIKFSGAADLAVACQRDVDALFALYLGKVTW